MEFLGLRVIFLEINLRPSVLDTQEIWKYAEHSFHRSQCVLVVGVFLRGFSGAACSIDEAGLELRIDLPFPP